MATASVPARDDVQPCSNERLDRFLTGTVTVLPFIGIGIAAWQVWGSWLHPSDLIVFAIMYVLCGLGITVGFHRLLTHRAFQTTKAVRFAFTAMGSMAIEGPVISWVSDHRKHHTFADEEGDPHTPHGHDGIWRGLLHAHVGWVFHHDQRGAHARYAPDLLRDPVVSYVHRTFLVWVLAGLAIPFALGGLIGGSWSAALTGLLWGGLVRMFVLHHVTYAINSVCHVFGRRVHDTDDHSTNVWWLAIPSFGESWHNNHHAFPTSARHGLGRFQVDLSALTIRGLEKLGLAWDVKQPRTGAALAKD